MRRRLAGRGRGAGEWGGGRGLPPPHPHGVGVGATGDSPPPAAGRRSWAPPPRGAALHCLAPRLPSPRSGPGSGVTPLPGLLSAGPFPCAAAAGLRRLRRRVRSVPPPAASPNTVPSLPHRPGACVCSFEGGGGLEPPLSRVALRLRCRHVVGRGIAERTRSLPPCQRRE